MSDRSTLPSADPADGVPPPRRRRRGPVIATVVVVAALAAGGAAFAFLALEPSAEPQSRPGRVESTSAPERTVAGAATRPTPRPSASAAPLESGPTPPTLDVFELTGQVECTLDGPPEYLEARWSSTGAIAAYIGVDTADAHADGLGIELPPGGTHRDFPDGHLAYPCGADTLVFTLTVVGPDGEKASLRETVKNVGDVY